MRTTASETDLQYSSSSTAFLPVSIWCVSVSQWNLEKAGEEMPTGTEKTRFH